MARKSILFVSWQGGLGHVTRDLAIVSRLRKQNPDLKVSWIAHPLACKVLQEAGETPLPESQFSTDYNQAGAQALGGFKLNLTKYVLLTRGAWRHNVALFKEVVAKQEFDLVIGDESYELLDALASGAVRLKSRFIMIHDFLGSEAMTWNPLEMLLVYVRNRRRCYTWRSLPEASVTHLFVGELEDIPDRRFGFLLPNRREFAKTRFHFLGPILRFDPALYMDKKAVRSKLGYGEETLVICATGGTCAGKELLDLGGKAYPILKRSIPDLRMIFVCGELFGQRPPQLPPDVELRDYIPNIFEHYAACDFAIVVGGGTTTTELTALRRPFIFFPLESQFDQQLYVAGRLTRQGAGIKMRYHQTTPELLAQTILAHIGKEVHWEAIPIDGAQKATELINGLLADGHEVAGAALARRVQSRHL